MAAGGALGGLGGFLIGIGTLAIPGVGPFIAAGPILAALSGAAIGAATGGVAGGLIGLGIPEYEAGVYDEKIRKGKTLLASHCDDAQQVEDARQILENMGATDISTTHCDSSTLSNLKTLHPVGK